MDDEVTGAAPALPDRYRPWLARLPVLPRSDLALGLLAAGTLALVLGAVLATGSLLAALLGSALLVTAVGLVWSQQRLLRQRRTLYEEQARVDELERRVTELAALYEASRIGHTAHGAEEVLRQILRSSLRLLGGDRGTVCLLRGEDELRVVAAVGDRAERVRVGAGLESRVLASGQPELMDLPDESAEASPLEGQASAVAVPLRHGGRMLGVLSLTTGPERAVGPEDLEVLSLFAEQAAGAIAAAQVQESLQLQASQRLYQSQHDALTNLPTRELFLHHLEELLLQGRRVAVLLLDLDSFRRINESLGHAAGDAVLVEVAQRLHQNVRPGGLVARLGSDQFAFAEDGVEDGAAMEEVAARVRDGFAPTMRWEGREIALRARFGAALAGPHGRTAEELLLNADTALHIAKTHPETELVLFERSMHREAVWRMDLESGLLAALEQGQMELKYQPIIELASGDVMGYEALVRWRHPELGVLPPSAWVRAVEESELCGQLDLWVLERAAAATARMLAELGAGRPLYGHVNISPGSLALPGFSERVREVLERVELPARLVVLEITERAVVSDIAAVRENVAALRDLGLRLALDDFGTGYSALGYLRRFPVDGVKIDHMFIDAVVTDPDARALVQGIIRLSEGLGLDVVAEGIERQDQLKVLRELGCRYGQGWLFSRSLSEAEFARVAQAGTDTMLLRTAPTDADDSAHATGA